MTRGGAGQRRETGDEAEAPERRCLVTGDRGPKAGLIRFVAGPDGQVVPDVLGRLPGRGFWVTSTREALDRAAAKGLFSRAARTKVTTPAELADLIEGMLARRVVELISLTRKAGLAATGYEKVKDWLVNGTATVLIQASDGSERGKSKLRPPEKTGLFIGCLTAQEIGLAFGREHAIHGALAAGGLSNRVVEEAARLAGLRGGVGQQDGGETAGEDTKTV